MYALEMASDLPLRRREDGVRILDVILRGKRHVDCNARRKAQTTTTTFISSQIHRLSVWCQFLAPIHVQRSAKGTMNHSCWMKNAVHANAKSTPAP
mmetsp:Transcript_134789/g.268989  ORF Transcript_134789/g.268989 Transcript_134789/m.268989 type:complete len:96 (-) Transcript_134789:221-508(-)